MNKDIKIENDENVFNYRIAIVIKNNSKILVQKDDKVSHITLPGGRCELGETSIETSIREFKEETGIDIKYLRSIGMIENFFTSSFNNKKYHDNNGTSTAVWIPIASTALITGVFTFPIPC
ncbi:MAG: NUDIX domain-containing protein, partial [Bacilli bacterium]|nr:NUDIX domain-containing protein [Bacilli bacterium]